jgi:hypothetical protein
MIEVRTIEAERANVVHPKKIARRAAVTADPIPDRLDDQHAGWSLVLRHAASPPVKAD